MKKLRKHLLLGIRRRKEKKNQIVEAPKFRQRHGIKEEIRKCRPRLLQVPDLDEISSWCPNGNQLLKAFYLVLDW